MYGGLTMKIEVEIDDNEILEMAKEKASDELAKRLFSFYREGREARQCFYDVAKKILYEPATKKELMDRAVSQAAAEIRRKAMPFLEDEIKKGAK
jgi:hypothetical protein